MKLRRRAALAAFWILLALWPVIWAGIGPLYNETDGQYAAAARAMSEGGSWLVPENNGVPRLVKPPLYTWMIAAAMKIFGPSEFAARLPGALAVSLTGLAIFGMAWEAGARRVAMVAAALWLALLGNYTLGRIVMPEPVFTAFLTLALGSFQRAWNGEGVARRRAVMGMWIFAGLAAFCKGPHGLLVPVAAASATLLGTPRQDRRLALRELFPWQGLALALAMNVPWYLAIEARFPGFFLNLVAAEWLGHLAGSKAPATDRGSVPRLAFLALQIAWLLPASAALAGIRWRQMATWPHWSHAARAATWAAFFILAPVLLAGQRQDYYAMSAWPFFVLGLAWTWGGARWQRVRAAMAGVLALAILGSLVAAAASSSYPRLSLAERATALETLAAIDRGTWLRLAGLAAAGCGVGIAFLASRLRAWQALAASGACLGAVAASGTAVVSPLFSAKPLAQTVLNLAGDGGLVFFDGDVDSASSFLFYTHRRIMLVGGRPEADFVIRTTGLGRENYVLAEEVAEWWRSSQRVVLICDAKDLPFWSEKLGKLLSPPAASSGSTVILANPAAHSHWITSPVEASTLSKPR